MNDRTAEGLARYFPYKPGRINYLANCSKKHMFVYMEIPKAACTTIKRVLQLIEVDNDDSKLFHDVHRREKSPLKRPRNVGVEADRLFEGDEYFRFTFVRNPYSRILSAYIDKLVTNEWERKRMLPELGFKKTDKISLLQFLEAIRHVPDSEKNIHWSPQWYLLQVQKVDYHFIGRFENFSNGLERVVMKIAPSAPVKDMMAVRFDGHRTGAGRQIDKFVGPKERDLILELFERDFAVFGYSMDPHFGAV